MSTTNRGAETDAETPVTIPATMRALCISDVTPASEARLSEVPVPAPTPGRVLIRVRGFGLNHSEQMLRMSEIRAPYIKRPCVPGIECVGEVADPGDTALAPGQPVCALMGGMGRSFWGSYAEYALVPVHHVFAIPEELVTRLGWAELAAVPETYYTAWGSLFEGLRLAPDDILLVRGATCALGESAIQLARATGARVVATTHREERLPELEEQLGTHDVATLDTGELAGRLDDYRITKALELVGPATLADTMRCLVPGGICCTTGVLGGVEALDGFDPITDIPNGTYLTGFYSNYPTQRAMDKIFAFMLERELRPHVGARYDLAHLPEALAAQDRGGTRGKIVVTADGK